MILILVLTAACSRGEEPVGNQQSGESAGTPAGPTAENATAGSDELAADARSPEAAVAVLKDYVRLIGERKFVEAHKLWSGDELSDGAFADRFSRFRTYGGEIGEPGRIEGAAGSLYIEIPVTITGTLNGGEDFRQTGSFTLRRANDVPGATPEQLQWRIYKTDLRPREVAAADYRFVGRWASEARNCGDPWIFTASSLKTPAGAVCSFSRVREVPGGYDIAASCTAEGPVDDDTLRLRFAESARALLFESRTIADAGLVRCR
jgi:hypothetical protein